MPKTKQRFGSGKDRRYASGKSKTDIDRVHYGKERMKDQEREFKLSKWRAEKQMEESNRNDERDIIPFSFVDELSAMFVSLASGQTSSPVTKAAGPETVALAPDQLSRLSVGLETVGGIMTTMIPQKSTLPARKEQVFTTCSDNQPAVMLKTFEGERAKAQDNKLLCKVEVGRIPLAPRGVPQVSVVYELATSGILKVTVHELLAGKKFTLVAVTTTERDEQSDEVVEKMVKKSIQYKEKDEKFKKRVEARNGLESFTYLMRDILSAVGDKLSPEDLKMVSDAVNRSFVWLSKKKYKEDTEPALFEAKKEQLLDACKLLVEQMYKELASDAAEESVGESASGKSV